MRVLLLNRERPECRTSDTSPYKAHQNIVLPASGRESVPRLVLPEGREQSAFVPHVLPFPSSIPVVFPFRLTRGLIAACSVLTASVRKTARGKNEQRDKKKQKRHGRELQPKENESVPFLFLAAKIMGETDRKAPKSSLV